jgi:eukaryotic-like serine/threonine-protein kinase
MVGRVVSHYKILEHLGGGGMGVVYKAQDTRLKRTVALKFLPPELTRAPDAKERFVHEAEAASALQHNNICVVHDIDETSDGQMFISMEYLQGETLKKKIERGPLKIDEAIAIATQVAQGLAKAHEHGIIHRDTKPANIMVTTDGVTKIVDFGLAKLSRSTMLTKAGSTLGTASYMSPEQAQGEHADHRTDIWSLGVVLYEMLTGVLPFKGEYEQGLIYQILNSPPAPLTGIRTGIPSKLERIVNKCLEKNRDERYQTAADLIADLRHFQRAAGTGTETMQRSNATAAEARRRMRWWYGALPAIAIVGAVAFYLGKTSFSKPEEGSITSIAVLPFQNLSSDPGQEYFSDGMTEAIIKELSQIRALRVISRTSVMRYRNTEKAVPEIARELGVETVVEGSVLRADPNVRITAQLIAADPERHLWAKDFTRSFDNVLLLQSEIAQAIAREIRIAVTSNEQERIAQTRQVDPEAHEAYLKGEYFVNKAIPADVYRGIPYFQQAIAKDSTYAPGYAGLAKAYSYLEGLGVLSPREGYPKVKTYATKALSLDPTLAVGVALLADVKFCYDWDFEGAEEYYRKAIELEPNLAECHLAYGWFFAGRGRFDSGIAELRQARQLDPLSVVMAQQLALMYAKAGQYESSLRYAQRAAEIDSTFPNIAAARSSVYLAQGMYAKAIEEARKMISLGDSSHGLSILAIAYALSGQSDRAREILSKFFEVIGNNYVASGRIAQVYGALGDRERVFEYLEKAYEERDENLIQPALMPPWCEFIKSDPRYKALMKKAGLE